MGEIDGEAGHQAARLFAANCGTRTSMKDGGLEGAKWPELQGRNIFPRTDPVVIMLVTGGDKVLLGRSEAVFRPGCIPVSPASSRPRRPSRTRSAAKSSRESGIRCTDVELLYDAALGPIRPSLMIGLHRRRAATNEVIVVDRSELEDARWFDRAEAETDDQGRQHPRRLGRTASVRHCPSFARPAGVPWGNGTMVHSGERCDGPRGLTQDLGSGSWRNRPWTDSGMNFHGGAPPRIPPRILCYRACPVRDPDVPASVACPGRGSKEERHPIFDEILRRQMRSMGAIAIVRLGGPPPRSGGPMGDFPAKTSKPLYFFEQLAHEG